MIETVDNNNDQIWEEGLSPAADALHRDLEFKVTSRVDYVDTKSKLNLKYEYISELPISEMDKKIEGLGNDFVNQMWGETKDEIRMYYAKAMQLQSECLAGEDGDDLRTRAEARSSLDQALRALHGSIMTNLNIIAGAYYKKKGEVKWYEYFLKGNYNFSPEVFDKISGDLMNEYGQQETAVNPLYRDKIKNWFLSRAEDLQR
jgi:hypothetical protein